ncbi:hypothetical protein T484DRAFT_2403228 [Baffinella frigidus]|nr:hypothetical protein T484DRAFT_2403228 [Cryptophyta sp. CCMP2293]
MGTKRKVLMQKERNLRLAVAKLAKDWEWQLEKHHTFLDDEREATQKKENLDRKRENNSLGLGLVEPAKIQALSRTQTLAHGRQVAARPTISDDAMPEDLRQCKKQMEDTTAAHMESIRQVLGQWKIDKDVFQAVKGMSEDINLGKVSTRAGVIFKKWMDSDPGTKMPKLDPKPKKFTAAVSAMINSTALARVITHEREDLMSRHPPNWEEEEGERKKGGFSRAPSVNKGGISREPSSANPARTPSGVTRTSSSAGGPARTPSIARAPSQA